jgi:hypothetical protein
MLFLNLSCNTTRSNNPYYKNTIRFSGYKWKVKNSESRVGPGPNYFSADPSNVWVDKKGLLHLKLRQKGENWYCAEVVLSKSLGYGKYIFNLATKLDELDKNIVFGIFTWNDKPDANHHEVDIELSKWGNEEFLNSQYVVQPDTSEKNKKRFEMKLEGNFTSHIINWNPDSLVFESYHGNYISSERNVPINSWSYSHSSIPDPRQAKIRINIWLFKGITPSDLEEQEVIVESFNFIPM